MPDENGIRCLILACGNSLRGDDGVGPWLAAWAEERFRGDGGVRVLSRQQWTPELAEEISQSERVVFVDCSIDVAPGTVRVIHVEPSSAGAGLASHHLRPGELLALALEVYASLPGAAVLLTVGAESMELGATLSLAAQAALPGACAAVERMVSGELPPARWSRPK